jgi:hypothetical protein
VQDLRSTLPWHVKFRIRAWERSQGGGWFNYDPGRHR